ncbi:MAG TPA: toxin YdaT family protein [Arsenophonus apicola]
MRQETQINMEIDIQALKDEIEIWAMASGQERVAIEVSRMYFQLNSGGKPRLSQIEDKAGQADWKAINNNRQQIFRWLRGDSKAAKQKFCDLIPAILTSKGYSHRHKVGGEFGRA